MMNSPSQASSTPKIPLRFDEQIRRTEELLKSIDGLRARLLPYMSSRTDMIETNSSTVTESGEPPFIQKIDQLQFNIDKAAQAISHIVTNLEI